MSLNEPRLDFTKAISESGLLSSDIPTQIVNVREQSRVYIALPSSLKISRRG